MPGIVKSTVAVMTILLLAVAVWQLKSGEEGVVTTPMVIEGIPATVFTGRSIGKRPAVVIAHGFAGSQQLMQSFALHFARHGYLAITFDFAGHGRNTQPMTGDVDLIDGATRRLVEDVTKVAAQARRLGDGRLAILGHSMASDIVIRFAESEPSVTATIGVSTFSPAVTRLSPRNLLLIAGSWEGMLKQEALRAVGLVAAPQIAQPGVTYGEFNTGTARRAVFSPDTEHVSVLFSRITLRESLAWLDRSFGFARAQDPEPGRRGVWILVLLGGVVGLAWPLSSLLPRVSTPPAGSALGWPRMWPALVMPMLATPLVLRIVPTHFLSVLVADYLAAHFLVYGAITTASLLWICRRDECRRPATPPLRPFATALLLVVGYGLVGLVWPIDKLVTSFVPSGNRPGLIAVLLLGTCVYFTSDEWLTRGEGAARGAYPATKLAFLASLALAVALDAQRLFFLVIIVPVIVLFFLVYGLWSRWIYDSTGNPLVGGLASALAFAWAIGVVFPLVAG